MAYQVTTALSQRDVCDKIAAFAIANAGFILDSEITGATTHEYVLKRADSECYWSIHNNNNLNNIYLYLGYSKTVRNSTVGCYDWCECTGFSYSPPYANLYLFTEGTCVHAVIEWATGVFNHYSFGTLDKKDTYTGGEFVSAGYYSYRPTDANYHYNAPLWSGGYNSHNSQRGGAYVRCIPPTATKYSDARDFAKLGWDYNGHCASGIGYSTEYDSWIKDMPTAATSRSPLLPNNIWRRDNADGLWTLLGTVPGMKFLMLGDLDPAEIVLNEWQVFPFIQKVGTGSVNAVTGGYGVAYKRA